MRAVEIFEGRDAPLYHATNYDLAQEIIAQNVLKAQELPETDQWDTRDEPVLSLTRSFRFATEFLGYREGFQGVVFELDQTKIAQRYSIKPWNYYFNAEVSKSSRVLSPNNGVHNEYEEFITKDLTNLSNYLRVIHVFGHNPPKELLSHPLAKWHTKRKRPLKFNTTYNEELSDLSGVPVNEIFEVQKEPAGYFAYMISFEDRTKFITGSFYNNKWQMGKTEYDDIDVGYKKFKSLCKTRKLVNAASEDLKKLSKRT